MAFFFKSSRIGKGGKPFLMYKIRTLKEGKNTPFAHQNGYTWCGRFLRKYRLDETPQLWNLLNGTMRLVGPRPEEQKTIELIPQDIRNKILSIKPGWFDMAGVFFFDEEEMLRESTDPAQTYWTQIKPMKLILQSFYVENRCFLLDVAIIYMGFKKAIKSIWRS